MHAATPGGELAIAAPSEEPVGQDRLSVEKVAEDRGALSSSTAAIRGGDLAILPTGEAFEGHGHHADEPATEGQGSAGVLATQPPGSKLAPAPPIDEPRHPGTDSPGPPPAASTPTGQDRAAPPDAQPGVRNLARQRGRQKR